MSYVLHQPAPPLDRWIDSIWDWRVPPRDFGLERILPAPGSALIINLLEDESRVYEDDAGLHCDRTSGAVFSGQFTRSFVIDTREQVSVIGVAFKPGGAQPFLRDRMDRFGNGHVDLDAIVGADGTRLRERLLQMTSPSARIAELAAWLQRRLVPVDIHPAIADALARMDRSPQVQRIDAWVRDSGLSPRHFSGLFREHVGVAPKAYLRMLRFRRVIGQAGSGVDWARVAGDCGFHDQPHLNREFRAFSGMTPREYLARRGTSINHVALPLPD